MQQPGDELTYWAVDAILHGTNIDYYAMVPEESFGRWAYVLRQLLLAHASGGQQAVLGQAAREETARGIVYRLAG